MLAHSHFSWPINNIHILYWVISFTNMLLLSLWHVHSPQVFFFYKGVCLGLSLYSRSILCCTCVNSCWRIRFFYLCQCASVIAGTVLQIRVFGPEARHSPVQDLSPSDKCLSLCSNAWALRLQRWPLPCDCIVLGLMVASFKAVLYTQFYYSPLEHSILVVWNKQSGSLNLPHLHFLTWYWRQESPFLQWCGKFSWQMPAYLS